MGVKIDLTGKRFGKLTIIKEVPKEERKNPRHVEWLCQCDCGNTHTVISNLLTKEKTKSCGCLRWEKAQMTGIKNDIVGKKFGLLTVIERVLDPKNNHKTIWLCQCDCGNIHYVERRYLINGHVNSCGCLRRKSLGELKI
jgi:hypothetical protein